MSKYEGYLNVRIVDAYSIPPDATVLDIIPWEETRSDCRYLNTNGMSSSFTIPVKQYRLLIGMKRDEFLEKLKAELVAVHNINDKLEVTRRDWDKERTELQNKIKAVEAQASRTSEVAALNKEEYQKQLDKTKLMEKDIAKIRTAIGELKMKEIINGN